MTFVKGNMKYFIILTISTFIPKRFAAFVFGPIIFVRKAHRNNVPLIEHEKVHVRQFWRTFCTHFIWYQFNDEYRLKAEVEGYATQIKHRELLGLPRDYDRYTTYICTLYGLKVSHERVREMLVRARSKL